MTDEELAGWARNWHWNDCAGDPEDPSIYFRDMRMLKAFIVAAEAHRDAEKRKNCKHSNTIGSGGTGNAIIRWNCLDCGVSYSSDPVSSPSGSGK
jgi:hypothetical protein